MADRGSGELGPTDDELYERDGLTLGHDEIRLLILLPDDRGSKPICRLEKRLLQKRGLEIGKCDTGGAWQEDPVFAALSYVWGSTTDPQAITCNGADFFVTRNLFAALIDLRSANEPTTLWTDAICINQRNDSEKSRQVARMGEIYSRAAYTIAWLGSPSYLSYFGFKALQSTATSMRTRFQGNGNAIPATVVDRLLRRLGFSRLFMTVWDHSIIIPLLQREYFSRIWIVQEMALSRHLDFVCGNDRITISDFILGSIETLASDTGRWHLSTIVNILLCRSLLPWAPQHGLEDAAYILARLTRLRGDITVQKNLLALLNLFRSKDATDSIDKIFGLTGLSKEISRDGTWGVEQLYPICSELNRNEPFRVELAFTSVAKRILEGQQTLQLLGSVCHHGRMDASPWNLPSWVPDWTNMQSIPRPFATTKEPSDTLEVATLFPDGPRTLVLAASLVRNGDIIDRIEAVGGLCDSESWRRSKWFLMKNGLTFSESHRLDVVNAWRGQFLSGAPAPTDEFIAVATGGSAENEVGSSISDMLMKHRERSLVSLPLLHQLCLVYLLGRTWYLVMCPSMDQLYFVTLNWAAFFSTVFSISYLFLKFWPILGEPEVLAKAELRRMARTSHRLILAPAATLPGDVIALCRGGVVPLMLRPAYPGQDVNKTSDFKLVGECYVYNMMDASKWVFECNRTVCLD